MPGSVDRFRPGSVHPLLVAGHALGTQQLEVVHEAACIFLRFGVVEGVGVFEEGVSGGVRTLTRVGHDDDEGKAQVETCIKTRRRNTA